jgi:hypothetical protein
MCPITIMSGVCDTMFGGDLLRRNYCCHLSKGAYEKYGKSAPWFDIDRV